MDEQWDSLWTNARLATMTANGAAYGAIEQAAIAVKNGRIAWAGAMAELEDVSAGEVYDAGGRWITPGLIDCHSHIVYGGDRAAEFEQRLEGASYEEIARAGGGIVATVTATRAADEASLYASAAARMGSLMAEGVTTLEIKSGYGLDLETESKMLRVARRLGETLPVTVRTSFLGAHALPADYAGRSGDYIDFVCDEVMPAVQAAGLADAVDVFCETIGFSLAETMRVFDAAGRLGLPVKIHAEQLSDQGGAAEAARRGALSADHLEYLSNDGVAAMAEAGTVAVLLPGAFYFLRESRLPPLDALRAAAVPIAIATDCNPGSSPVTSILLMLNMACTLFSMTPEEALCGVTRNAARALGLGMSHGTLEAGKAADFVLWDIERPAELSYGLGANPIHRIIQAGAVLSSNPPAPGRAG